MRFTTRLAASLTLLAPLLAYAQDAAAPVKPANIEDDALAGVAAAAMPAAAGVVPHAEVDGAVVKADTVAVAPAAAAATTPSSDPDYTKPSIFNGVEVPPVREFKSSEFQDGIKRGYWLVKFYSPYCIHCKHFAPIWQTLYESYYTSKPVTGSSKEEDAATSLNTFERYYDFRFANINCVTEGDLCEKQEVNAYPTMILFKDGAKFRTFEGKKTLELFGDFIEESLELIRPGSRPKSVVQPSQGAHSTPPQPDSGFQGEAGSAARPAGAAATGTATRLLRPTATPNENGSSKELDRESFQSLVTMSQDPWFIKFYAPWCHHCQALAPNWEQMARELKGKLNIGAVNCEAQRALCQDIHVKAYPTLHFFRGGERVEYNGLRGLGDLVTYAKKAVDIGMGVEYVTADDFKRLEEKEEVIFLYFYDHATTSEDFAALDRLTLSLVGHAKLVKSDSKALADRFKIHTWPKLIVVRDERASYFNALAPKDMRDFRGVLNWMQTVWLPLVPELTASNAHEIMDGHLVVLGILSRDRPDEFQLDRKEMKNAARDWMDRETRAFQLERAELRDSKQLRIEEADDRGDKRALRDAKNIRIQITEEDRKQVRFAWVDGIFWERWIRTTYGVQIKDGERVVIVDEDTKRFWDQTISGEPIRPSRTSIMETLQKITVDPPRIAPKYTTNRVAMLFLELKRLSRRHPWLATIVFIGSIFSVATWGRGRIRRSKSGTGGFHILGEKDGLFSSSNGGGVNGKSD